MKANQINMEVSSIAPALLALYACYQGARSVFFRLHRLLPSTRHEQSRDAELRFVAKKLRLLEHSFLCGAETLCPEPAGGVLPYESDESRAARWRVCIGAGRQQLLVAQLAAIASDNPFSYTVEGTMQLVLQDLAELRAPWRSSDAKRCIVERMHRNYAFLAPAGPAGWSD